jgi:hypothetical protein
VRLNTVYAFGLTVAQWTSLALMLIGVALVVWIRRRHAAVASDGELLGDLAPEATRTAETTGESGR